MKQYTKPSSDSGTRIMGIIVLLGSALLGYMHILSPLMKAVRGESHIIYSTEAVLAAPFGILFGLYLLILGGKGLDKPPAAPVLIILIILAAIVVLGCYFGMSYLMKSLGYS